MKPSQMESLEKQHLEFSIEKDGFLDESIRQQKVFMVNEYSESNAKKKDLPFNHVHLSRLLVVPVIRDGHTVMIGTVANKKERYADDDVLQISIFLEGLWERMSIIKAEEALKKSDAKLFHAHRISHIGYWELDLATHILTGSDEINNIFEIDLSNLNATYETFINTIHPDDRVMLADALNYASQNDDGYELDHRLLMPDGRVKYLHQHFESFHDAAGKPMRITGIVQDISWRKHLENLLHKKNEELIKLNDDKDRFMSILAHDLKSPFNSILGFLELLTSEIREYDIETIENQLNIVYNSGKQFYNMLDDLLMWTRSQSGKLNFEPRKVRFTAVSEDILSDVKLIADSKNITVNNLARAEIAVFADVNMLKIILRNLVINAIKFTHPGGKIDIDTEQTPAELTISVSDNGVGIAPEFIDKLFDITQLHSTTGTANESGSGLGLILIKEFVEKHGGKIWVESKLQKGSTFYFTLPVNIDAKAEAVTEDIALTDPEDPKEAGLKILIADDDESSDQFLAAAVKKIGKSVLTVKNGYEAVEACLNNPDLDLVLMDIRMPEMDGYEATRQIRLFNKDLVIIAQTSFVLTENKKKAIAAGCNAYISKPIKKDKLLAVIHEFFQN